MHNHGVIPIRDRVATLAAYRHLGLNVPKSLGEDLFSA